MDFFSGSIFTLVISDAGTAVSGKPAEDGKLDDDDDIIEDEESSG